MNDKIYILPTQDKPIKFIIEELPCPICQQIGYDFRCEHAKSSFENMIYTISCTNFNKCNNTKYISLKYNEFINGLREEEI
jgi:hypothetical protein